MSEFCVLDHPDTRDANSRLASWPKNEKLVFREVRCTVNPDGHRGVRERITSPLSMVLPDKEPLDFVWTHLGECAVQEHVLRVFANAGFQGYEAIPVKVRFKSSARTAPRLWELAVKGSAGLAHPDSGLRVLRHCPGCDLTDYSPITEPTKVVDQSRWDGTDFFRVTPLEGWIFVTRRVIDALRDQAVTGWRARSLADMKHSFDIAIPA